MSGAAGIEHRAVHVDALVQHGPETTSWPAVKVEFPSLTEAQFAHLMRRYHGEGAVPYEQGRSYELVDFLPRMMQATLGHSYRSERIGAHGLRLSLETNCWGTAYEFARSRADSLKVFLAPALAAGAFFADDRYSDFVARLKPGEDARAHGQPELRFGDVLAIYFGSTESIDTRHMFHAAVYLDRDLFYEKTGAGSEHLYRLTTLAEIASEYPPDIYQYVIRRFGKTALPEPEVAFAGGGEAFPDMIVEERVTGSGYVDTVYAAVRKVPFVLDPASRRYRLGPRAYLPSCIQCLPMLPAASKKSLGKGRLSR